MDSLIDSDRLAQAGQELRQELSSSQKTDRRLGASGGDSYTRGLSLMHIGRAEYPIRIDTCHA